MFKFCAALLCCLLLISVTVQASFIERCVLYGKVESAPKLRDEQVQFLFSVHKTIRLHGSHGDCAYSGQSEVTLLSPLPPINYGDWLLLNLERADSMCSARQSCATEHWQLLTPVGRAHHPNRPEPEGSKSTHSETLPR